MQRIIGGMLVLILSMVSVSHGQDKPATPAEQYKALLKEYDRASSSGVPLTDAERLKFVGQVYKQRSALALKFLELGEKNPDDPIALDALSQAVWQVNSTPGRLNSWAKKGSRPSLATHPARPHPQ